MTMFTEPLCLSGNVTSASSEYRKIACEAHGSVIFMSQVRYTDAECPSAKGGRCSAYTTDKSAQVCNGRADCAVKLVPVWFDYGRSGANCAFGARTLHVSYECIPSELHVLHS